MALKLLQDALVVLKIAFSGMETQDAHEDVLVVGALCNCLDEVNVGVLRTLARGVVAVAPHDNVTDLMQDAVRLLKVLAAFLSTLLGKIGLQEIQKIYSVLVQVRKLRLADRTRAGGHIPLHALDEDLNNVVTGV